MTWHPQDIEVEKSVLSALLQDIEILHDSMPLLFPELFYSDINRTVYEAICDIYQSNGKVDIVSVVHRLREKDRLDFVGGPYYISQLTNVIYSNSELHIRILTQLWIKRQHLIISQRALNHSTNPTFDVFESHDELLAALSEIDTHIIGKEFTTDVKTEIEKVYQYQIAPRESRHTGIKTDSGKVNQFLTFNKKELIILAARPSMGKTTRMLQFAIEAMFEKFKVGIFSIEMSKEEIYKKMLLNIARLDASMVQNQEWTDEQFSAYTQAKDRIKFSNLFICDMGTVRPSTIRTIARQRKRQYGLDILFIDYLQMMKPDRDMQNRQNDVSSISTELKILAKELEIPVIALSQLSRECERRLNKRPMLSDLRDSGQIEQDADIVLSLFSPAYYGKDDEYAHLSEDMYKQVSELAILKNRNGAAGIIIEERFINTQSLFI